MRFLDPWFLLGLGALAVPLALHLLHRRRVPVLEFPLARLVARAERSRQPRKRLNRLLLLAARACLLALLALALARTTLGPATVAAVSGPSAVVVVMDDSLSMSLRDASGRTAFESGAASARELLAALPDGSFACVLPASAPEAAAALGLSPDVGVALDSLARLEPTLRHVRLGDGLRAAARLLEGASLADRRVVLVSDLARHAFEGLHLPAAEASRPRLVTIAAAPPPAGPNAGVTGLDVETLPDGRLRATVRAAAWNGEAGALALELRVGRVGEEPRLAARGVIEPGAGASAERRFEVAPPAEGWVRVEAALEGDALAPDDSRVAVLRVERRSRLLVVDGDPQNLAIGCETFYVEKALSPEVGLDFPARIVTLSELSARDVEQADAVLLCNAPEVSDDRARALESAVRGGAGLVVALGNRVSQPVYNGRLASLLPATLGPPRTHEPALHVARDAATVDLSRMKVRGSYSLEPDPDAEVLLRLDDGTPLLAASRFGSGRVVLFASTLDRDWNDLPIQPAFLPFLRTLVESVTSRPGGEALPDVTVGQPVALPEPPARRPARAVLPDSSQVQVPKDGPLLATDSPGAILLEDEAGAPVAAVAVVTDPAESDLVRLSPDEIARLVSPAFETGAVAGGEGTAAGGWPAWKAFLVLLVGLAAAESWLARRAA